MGGSALKSSAQETYDVRVFFIDGLPTRHKPSLPQSPKRKLGLFPMSARV